MLCTIEIGTCVSVQGEFVQMLANGEIVIRDGAKLYRGRRVDIRDPAADPFLRPARIGAAD